MPAQKGLFSSLFGKFSKNHSQDEFEEAAAVEARRRLEERIEQVLAEGIPPEAENPDKAINIEAA